MDVNFLLKAKVLNDNGYFFTNQFDYSDQFDNYQIGHIVQLDFTIPSSQID
jgi:hypothetical protein